MAWLLLGIGATPLSVHLDPCVGALVDTTSVAAALSLELLPRSVLWSDPGSASARLDCATPDAVRISAGRAPIVLLLADLDPADRARAIALAFAEELRSGAPELGSTTALDGVASPTEPGGPRLEVEAPAANPAEPVALLVETAFLKPINDPAVAFSLAAAVADTSGSWRPRFGGFLMVGQGDQKQLYALALALGATLVLAERPSWSLGVDASASGGLVLQDKLAPFGLLLAGLAFEIPLSGALSLEARLAAGSFVPAAATALFSVGLSFAP